MLTGFSGRVLVPPVTGEHGRSHIQLALLMCRQAIEKHGIKDTIVAVERNDGHPSPDYLVGLIEPTWDDLDRSLQLLVRHRCGR